MSRPSDPAALAALRARQAAASRAYRARQAAAAAAKKPRGAQPHGGGVVDRARAEAAELRTTRAAELAKLKDVRNPQVKIRPPEIRPRAEGPARKTKAAQARRAAIIRERANAERLQAVGRARKANLREEITSGPIADQLGEMAPNDRDRFGDLIARISRGSAQSLGILFNHLGGQGLYSGAIEKILYGASRQEGLDMLETLAEYAEAAAVEYAPSKIGRLTF